MLATCQHIACQQISYLWDIVAQTWGTIKLLCSWYFHRNISSFIFQTIQGNHSSTFTESFQVNTNIVSLKLLFVLPKKTPLVPMQITTLKRGLMRPWQGDRVKTFHPQHGPITGQASSWLTYVGYTLIIFLQLACISSLALRISHVSSSSYAYRMHIVANLTPHIITN